MTTLNRLLSYTKRYWKYLFLSGITATLFGVFSAAPTYIIQHAIDGIIIGQRPRLLIPFLCGFLLLYLLKALFMFLSSYYMEWVGNRVVNDLRSDLFKKIIYFPLSFYQRTTTGELLAHFLNDITQVQNAASTAVRNGIRSLFEVLFLGGVAFHQNWKLAMLMITTGPIIAYAIRTMGVFMRRSAQFSQQKMGQISSILQELFVGIREIKTFNTEKCEISRFTAYLENYFTAMMKNAQLASLAPAMTEIISMTGTSIVLYAAIKQVMDGIITPGQLASFFTAILLAYQPLKRLINIYSEVQTGLAAADRVFAVMDRSYPKDLCHTIPLPSFNHTIEFRDVSFAYTPHAPVIEHVDLTIYKGESIGVVGPSGSGKSTFCDLLLGFIEPTAGTVAIDNHDLATLSLASLRQHIGYVSQRPFLFNDTIYANIAYGSPHATSADVVQACKTAFAHEFIMKLPHGYQTMVGENGALLSGGQKQRVTIARALLKRPEILLFDEATSSLDGQSEAIIRQALEEICKHTTVIIISHRMPLIEGMQRIFTIQNRQIIEIGKQELKETRPYSAL